MTREEIIRNLEYTMEKHKNDTVNTFGTNISVMCKDILDYLEQEPKTGYISIDDVMSVFDDFMCGEVDEDGTDTFLEMLRDKAEQYQQEPKTGHWTYIRNSEVNGLKIVECSECGKRTYGSGNYCPNCGARMVELQESEGKE